MNFLSNDNNRVCVLKFNPSSYFLPGHFLIVPNLIHSIDSFIFQTKLFSMYKVVHIWSSGITLILRFRIIQWVDPMNWFWMNVDNQYRKGFIKCCRYVDKKFIWYHAGKTNWSLKKTWWPNHCQKKCGLFKEHNFLLNQMISHY